MITQRNYESNPNNEGHETNRTTDKNHLEGIFSEALTSSNIVFTHRAIRPSVQPELEVDSMRQLAVAGKQIQLDTPAPPNLIAAALRA
jgi:hypothetical protein